MLSDNKILIGKAEDEMISILPKMANRHGLISGATGTGKTVTLKVLAESFSEAGVPVFLADIKGDLSGMCKEGISSDNVEGRIEAMGLREYGFHFTSYPTTFWDIYGKTGIPLRTTISEMGPILLSKLMNLTSAQSDILTLCFKIADDKKLLLIDTKDLKSMLQYLVDNASEISSTYGNISKASVNTIIRHIVTLETQGADKFFMEPAFNISDWFRVTPEKKGMINILDCRQLVNDSTMYSVFLLWMISELFETLPEIGDPEKPRMVFFFDEAHLLFKNISKVLQEKIEQIVKLIRSKGVGIYFITQTPKDIPDSILSQLGNKIQHALRAYTPADEKAVKAAASALRANPEFDTKTVISELGTGEALVSVLDEDGIPTVVKRCKILPPQSFMGVISSDERNRLYKSNPFYNNYSNILDRDSAYEFFERMKICKQTTVQNVQDGYYSNKNNKEKINSRYNSNNTNSRNDNLELVKATKRTARTTAGDVGREIGSSIGDTLFGRAGRRVGGNIGASLCRNLFGTFMK